MYKTIALTLLATAGLALADPSASGLEHRNSTFKDKHCFSVPDSGSTFALLSLGIVGLAAARRKLQF